MTERWHAGLSQACHGAERRQGTVCLQRVVMTECWHAGLSQACHGAERRRGTGQAVSAAGGDD